MQSGIVFDIQRFALHDGPGIRTTVFLKGCPLRCLWCHNPESQAYEPQFSFRRDKCNDDCACIDTCESGAHRRQDGRHVINFSVPAARHTCVDACPHGAGSIIGRDMAVDEVLDEVMKDEAYYRRSGGGLTLSGGEPLAQFDFAIALLSEAKRRGLDTCLDTCGAVSRRKIAAAAEVTDLFLFDYKATVSEEHRRLTGAGNETILTNLEVLHNRGASIILRCPLIPGVNDSDEHLRGIASIAARYPHLDAIHIMPFHNMGRDKAERVGMTPALGDLPSATEDQQRYWKQALSDLGCEAVLPA